MNLMIHHFCRLKLCNKIIQFQIIRRFARFLNIKEQLFDWSGGRNILDAESVDFIAVRILKIELSQILISFLQNWKIMMRIWLNSILRILTAIKSTDSASNMLRPPDQSNNCSFILRNRANLLIIWNCN